MSTKQLIWQKAVSLLMGGKVMSCGWWVSHSHWLGGNFTATFPFPPHHLPHQLLKPWAGNCTWYSFRSKNNISKKSPPNPRTPEKPFFYYRFQVWNRFDLILQRRAITTTAPRHHGAMQDYTKHDRELPARSHSPLPPVQPCLHSHHTSELPVLFASSAKVSLAVRPPWRCILQWGSASPSLSLVYYFNKSAIAWYSFKMIALFHEQCFLLWSLSRNFEGKCSMGMKYYLLQWATD